MRLLCRIQRNSPSVWGKFCKQFSALSSLSRKQLTNVEMAKSRAFKFCLNHRRLHVALAGARLKTKSKVTYGGYVWSLMWDNIGFAFRLVATCVRLVASDRRVAECGTILVLRFVSSLLVFVSSLQIIESPNVGQYWLCVSSRRFRLLSRRIGSVPMRLVSSRRSRIGGSRRSLLFAVSFFWVSTYRRFSFILLALFFIFSYAFLSLSFHISYGFTFRRVLSFVGSFTSSCRLHSHGTAVIFSRSIGLSATMVCFLTKKEKVGTIQQNNNVRDGVNLRAEVKLFTHRQCKVLT